MLLKAEPDLSYIGCSVFATGRGIELAFKVPGFDQLASTVGLGDEGLTDNFDDVLWRYRASHGDMRALR